MVNTRLFQFLRRIPPVTLLGAALVMIVAAGEVLPPAWGMGVGMRRHHKDGMGPMMGGGRNIGENPVENTAESVARGKALFLIRCQACHGAEGRGDGPAAQGLNPRPANLSNSAAVLPAGVLAGVITDGRGAMPAFKAILSTEEIWHVTNFLKSLAP